jgi:hypothetical protein
MTGKLTSGSYIATLLQKVGDLRDEGLDLAEALAATELTEAAYYRYRAEYGGLTAVQITRLRRLEAENARLKRVVSQLMLDKMTLEEARWENA